MCRLLPGARAVCDEKRDRAAGELVQLERLAHEVVCSKLADLALDVSTPQRRQNEYTRPTLLLLQSDAEHLLSAAAGHVQVQDDERELLLTHKLERLVAFSRELAQEK